MSPLISIRPFSAPSRTRFGCFATGSTRAIGSPLNVTVNGLPFFCTSFSILIHFALNSEIKTVFIRNINLVNRLGQLRSLERLGGEESVNSEPVRRANHQESYQCD